MPDAVALAMVEALPATAPTVGWQSIGSVGYNGGGIFGAAVSTDGSNVYLTHGYSNATGGQLKTYAYAFSPTTGVTTPFTSQPSVARQGVAGAWCNGKHYAIGGLNSSGSGVSTVEAYTPAGTNGASGVWSTVASIGGSSGQSYSSAAVIGNTIYLAGGALGTGAASQAISTLSKYDTTNNTWSTLAAMPAARTQGAMVAVGSKLYYLGGINTSGTMTNTVYVFDTTADTWTTGTALPTPRDSHSAAAVGNVAYIYGRRFVDGSSGGTETFSGITYDVTTGASTMLPDTSVSHGYYSGMAAINSAIYLVSGNGTANVDKLDLGAGVGFTTAVLGVKSLLNPLLAGVAGGLPNTPPTATADKAAYAQTVQTLRALTYIS